jgi:hypothetical protein
MASKERSALRAVAILLCMHASHASLGCRCPSRTAVGHGRIQISRYWEVWSRLGCTLCLHGSAQDGDHVGHSKGGAAGQRRLLEDAPEVPATQEKSETPAENFEGLDNEEQVS